jgi:hypothetical protein
MESTITPEQLYEKSVKNLSIVDRLQLVKLVLDDLMRNPKSWSIDADDVWSAEDYADLTRASLTYEARSSQEQAS